MITFNDIIAKSQSVFGAFLPKEIEALAKTADSLGSNCNFVEIGSYFGRSSVVLGMVARKNNCHLTCVDIFKEIPSGLDSSKQVKQEFIKNMADANAKYTLMEMLSAEASKLYQKSIDLLFIDGDHSYEGVKEDIRLWLPKVKFGGFVLFHDYVGMHAGVKRAVDETALIRLKVVETLLVAKVMATTTINE